MSSSVEFAPYKLKIRGAGSPNTPRNLRGSQELETFESGVFHPGARAEVTSQRAFAGKLPKEILRDLQHQQAIQRQNAMREISK